MAYKRPALASASPAGDDLAARMVGIGMAFAGDGDPTADLEQTLVDASRAGMDEGDLRVLSVLTTWLGVHHARVNADLLVRTVASLGSPRTRAYWAAIASWLARDRRFARLVVGHEGEPIDLLPTGTAFQITRRGEDPRFAGSALRVPLGTLRDRAADVLPPETLARRHPGYRNRVLMGPTFRADVWTALERAPELSVADVARRASCSFATAWQVTQDFRVLRG